MSVNGMIRLYVNTDPGVNPPAGRLYVWIEDVSGDKVYKYRDENGAVGSIGTAGTTPSFVALPDTPSSYSGQAGKAAVVNSGETALEFSDPVDTMWEMNPLNSEGIRPSNNSEISVGEADNPSESVFGYGDSYTGTDYVMVYSFDGTSYVDETSKIITEDVNKLVYPNLNAGSAIYMASKLSYLGDVITHPGLKLQIDTAAVLGTGDIVFEFWNGSSWEEFNHMSSQSAQKYLQYGDEKFEQTGSFQYLFNQSLSDTWTKNDPMTLGTLYYWTRYRISSAITTSPSFDRIKLHPIGRTEINEDGFITFYGISRYKQSLPISYGTFSAAGNSPANADFYLSDKLDVGQTENAFLDNTTDRSGFKIALPDNICTSCPITIHFAFYGPENVAAGNADFTIRWALFKQGDNIYNGTTAAPSTAPGEQSIAGSYPFAANQQWILQEMDISLAIQSAIPERTAGDGDYIVVSFERDGSGDTYAGNINMVDVKAQYIAWKIGGHL